MKFDFATLEHHIARLLAEHRADEAESLLRPFIRSGKSAPIPVWKLLVRVLRQQGKVDEMRRIQELLVTTTPQDSAARVELAQTLLLQGEFARGWDEYRHCYNLPERARVGGNVECPRWEGQPINGKTLLILDEQNVSDTIQFLRMVPRARQRAGARVILQIEDEQLPLASRAGGFDEIIPRQTPPPACDVYCEMMSLPTAVGLRLTDLPGSIPYLTADPCLVEQWRGRLATLPRPWVGLHWTDAADPLNDPARSISLGDLVPLALPGITFIPMQKAEKPAQAHAPPPGLTLVPLAQRCRHVEDTAAVLSILDLLISIDSTPVHLAGALGRSVWILLPFASDWRWMLSRTDSPWYPTARLFRQSRPGDWGAVIQDVSAELGKLRQR